MEQSGYESAHARLLSGQGSGPGWIGIILPHCKRRLRDFTINFLPFARNS